MVWMPWRRLQLGSTHRHFLDRICSGIPACFPNIFRPPGAALSRGPGTCSTNQVRFVSSRSTVEDECSAVEYSKRYAHQARACTAQHDTCIDTIGTICTYAPFLERYCPAWMVRHFKPGKCDSMQAFHPQCTKARQPGFSFLTKYFTTGLTFYYTFRLPLNHSFAGAIFITSILDLQ